ncbi:vanadium-dependent haloperoxidase [Paracnuella aquatica]|uniref:vanadium-dependent haloperoxidase n=1 Tax=Paracnuella aquatica TaxID=2268757 RepID=UPI000DF00427|nr:vanadium-dependent haloperoxidase [Paracnuella aquatica]RPD47438.1 phosphatase PAP2 family protein [Paracnuella aquatica]
MKKMWLPVLMLVLFAAGCRQHQNSDPGLLTDAGLLHRNMKALTEVIIHDAFSPPVASRIYSYTSIAAYEAMRHSKPGYRSVAGQLNAITQMPQPIEGKEYNYLLAATKAFFTVAEKITFAKDSLIQYQDGLYAQFAGLLDEETYLRSLDFGEAIGQKVLERTTKDYYKETRGMSKFIGTGQMGNWRPTAPDYMDAAEPHWFRVLPLALDSATQFRCPPPPAYSTDTASQFFKYAMEVYQTASNLTAEQKEIARYWDDNPFVMEHAGHVMYATKKITPVGHWIGIAGIASGQKGLNPVETAETYMLTSVAIYDAFIACWEEKYRTQVIRPITVINDLIDAKWQPMLQTPAFPEYTSGHSGISAAAATVLTERFGDNFAFEDTSDLEYIGMKRRFNSFHQAAQEASISRIYGGIHYRSGVEAGNMQGTKIGSFILGKIKTKE